MHSSNGNRKVHKNKSHLKIFQLNKGSSSINTYKSLILDSLDTHIPDIAITGDANLGINDNITKSNYKKYNIEAKFMLNCNEARLIVLIKKGIDYESLPRFEHNDLSAIWLKVKVTNKKYLYILCAYRQ